jgi:hypothetical protein
VRQLFASLPLCALCVKSISLTGKLPLPEIIFA